MPTDNNIEIPFEKVVESLQRQLTEASFARAKVEGMNEVLIEKFNGQTTVVRELEARVADLEEQIAANNGHLDDPAAVPPSDEVLDQGKKKTKGAPADG